MNGTHPFAGSFLLVGGLVVLLAVGIGCSDRPPPPSGGGSGDNVNQTNGGEVDAGSDVENDAQDNQQVQEGCPTAEAQIGDGDSSPTVDAEIGDAVGLTTTGEYNPDERELDYEWTIVVRPDGSNAELDPDGTVVEPVLEVDTVGLFEVEVDVSGADDLEDCEPAFATIEVSESADDILIRLSWSSPTVEQEHGGPDADEEIGTDLSTHYKMDDSPWGADDAVSYMSMNRDWGDDGDPQLDIDDNYGVDPEHIVHDDPADGGRYSYGVHYFCDNGYGESIATVEVFVEGTLIAEHERTLDETGDFWHVGDVVWGDEPSFEFVDEYQGEISELFDCE